MGAKTELSTSYRVCPKWYKYLERRKKKDLWSGGLQDGIKGKAQKRRQKSRLYNVAREELLISDNLVGSGAFSFGAGLAGSFYFYNRQAYANISVSCVAGRLFEELQEHIKFALDADSAIDIPKMCFDRSSFDFQSLSNLFIAQAAANKPGNIQLTRTHTKSLPDKKPLFVIKQVDVWAVTETHIAT